MCSFCAGAGTHYCSKSPLFLEGKNDTRKLLSSTMLKLQVRCFQNAKRTIHWSQEKVWLMILSEAKTDFGYLF